jgi:membrane protease YdiL (CAAX protease family)
MPAPPDSPLGSRDPHGSPAQDPLADGRRLRLGSRRRTAAEVGLAFGVATLAASLLYHAQGSAFVRQNLPALVAAVFLILPQILLRGRADLEQYGFTSRPRRLGLAVAAAGILGLLPLFSVGFVTWVRLLCAYHPSVVPGSCLRAWHPHLRLPPELAMLTAGQLLVVALPEELFFRGYLQGRLEDAWPPTRRLWGAPVGGALVVGAALFALGHYLVTFEPQMLSRFFPGLAFGWMYARTRSILAGTLFHAACNLLMDVLASSLL